MNCASMEIYSLNMWCSDLATAYNTIHFNFTAKCQYSCTGNVVWCQYMHHMLIMC